MQNNSLSVLNDDSENFRRYLAFDHVQSRLGMLRKRTKTCLFAAGGPMRGGQPHKNQQEHVFLAPEARCEADNHMFKDMIKM